MKFSSKTLLCALGVAPVAAFTNQNPSAPTTSVTALHAENKNAFSTFCATAAMSALLWGSPGMIAEQATTHQLPFGLNGVVEQHIVAGAKDKASATGSRVNKDAESLLRLGLPINSKEVCRCFRLGGAIDRCLFECMDGFLVSFSKFCDWV